MCIRDSSTSVEFAFIFLSNMLSTHSNMTSYSLFVFIGFSFIFLIIYSFYINTIKLFMSSKPFYLNNLKFKDYSYNQLKTITHNIKNYAIVCYYTYCTKRFIIGKNGLVKPCGGNRWLFKKNLQFVIHKFASPAVFQSKHSPRTDGRAYPTSHTGSSYYIFTPLCIGFYINTHLTVGTAIATGYALASISSNSESVSYTHLDVYKRQI